MLLKVEIDMDNDCILNEKQYIVDVLEKMIKMVRDGYDYKKHIDIEMYDLRFGTSDFVKGKLKDVNKKDH